MVRIFVAGTARWLVGPSGVTNTDGDFQIGDLVGGEYLIAVTSPSRLYYPSATSTSTAQPIPVEFGEHKRGIDFRLDRAGLHRVRGTLAGPPNAISGVLVRLVPRRDESLGLGAEAATAISDPTGGFTFLDVPAGQYTIIVSPTVAEVTQPHARTKPPANWSYKSGTQDPELRLASYGPPVATSHWGAIHVDVSERSESDTVSLMLQPAMRVTGRLVVPGTSQLGMTIVAEPADGDASRGRASVRATADGSFTIEGLVPGPYVLSVGNLLVSSMEVQARPLAGSVLDVSSAIDGLVVTAARGDASVTGQVIDRSNTGEGAMVLCYPADRDEWSRSRFSSRAIRRTFADSDGRYEVGGLLAGEYHVVAIRETGRDDWRNPARLTALASVGRTVRIDRGATVRVDVEVRREEP
jgi:hypothetical protein